MHRFFFGTGAGADETHPPCSAPLPPGSVVELTGSDAEHGARVLRLRPGDRVLLCDGQGWDYEAALLDVAPVRVRARVLAARPSRGEPPVFLTLVQGIPKGDKMDLVVQKAVEVGVSRIIPVFTARTVVAWEAAKAEGRRRRWQRIAYEAAKQAQRGRVPVVEPPVSLNALLKGGPGADDGPHGDLGLIILPWEEAGETGLREVLRQRRPGAVTVIIGPEGGLERAEVALAEARGASTVTLGPRVLRTETAGLVAASLILYEWGDLGGPPVPAPAAAP